MKKCLLFVFVLILPGWVFSQCTPSTITVPGLYPSITENLPIAYAGINYSTVVQVRTPLDTTVNGTYAKFTEVKIDGIGNLPAGFSYGCNPSNGTLGPLNNGCLFISGNPTLSKAGTYLLDINMTIKGKLYGVIPVTQQTSLSDYKIKIVGKPEANFILDKYKACVNEPVTFIDKSMNYPTSWNWVFTGGTPATSTLKNPVVRYTAPGKYKVKLIATSPAGHTSKIKDAIITISAPVVADLVSYAADTICHGDSILIEAVTGNNFVYTWLNNGNVISGAINSFYYAKKGGDYSVSISKSNSTCPASSSQSRHVKEIILNSSLIAAGEKTVCFPKTVTLLGTPNSNFSYVWYRNNVKITGANADSYIADISGRYKLKVTNKRGCSKTTSPTTVTINPKPGSSITTLDPTTFCKGDSVKLKAVTSGTNAGYQWYRNALIIPGAIAKNYYATKQGFYYVKVINQYGCNTKSKKINLYVNCKLSDTMSDSEPGGFQVLVSPNPASANAVLAFDMADQNHVKISLFDALGELKAVLAQGFFEAGEHEIYVNTAKYTPGLYFIKLTTEKETKTIKFIINK